MNATITALIYKNHAIMRLTRNKGNQKGQGDNPHVREFAHPCEPSIEGLRLDQLLVDVIRNERTAPVHVGVSDGLVARQFRFATNRLSNPLGANLTNRGGPRSAPELPCLSGRAPPQR